ncbi:MAG: DUF4199 domain-containing protein [Chitinophagales bacterium]|nr:DUF4199 domain-containing protein [Chitinophagales bacterium]
MDKIKIEIKWAIIFVFILMIWMVLERLGGFHDVRIDKHPIVTNFFMIPAVLAYVFALLDKKKNYYNGVMSYRQAFISGAILTLIVTLFSPLVQVISSMAISPDYFKNIIEYSVENEKMTRDKAEAYFNLKNYLIQVIIATPIMGLVTTAIVAIFVRSR